MGRLFLVRHGQASFLSQNYDQLSSLGETQARLLGEYWARHKLMFDLVGTGPAIRQRDTAQIMGEAYRKIGIAFPEPAILPEFDEYKGEEVLSQGLRQLLPQDQRIRGLHEAMQASQSDKEKRATFQRLFETVVSRWVNSELVLENAETWQEFCARVNRGLTHCLAGCGKGANAAIVSSGGPIAVAMQRALHLSPQDTLQLSWMSRNSSFSEFAFSGERFMLSSFNSHPHLDEESLRTYR